MAYLNEDGLNRFWGNFKNTFPYKSLRYEDIDVSIYSSKYGNDFSITPYALHSDIINTESFSGFLLKENLSDVTSVDIGTKIAVYMNSYTSSSSLSTGILSWVSDHYVCATGDESTLKIGYDSSNKTPFPASNKNLVFSLDESMSINSSAESKIYILEYIKYLPEGTSTYKYGWIVTDILQSKHIDIPDIPAEDVEKSVKFIDYDGTIVAQYTPAETASLSALPACPTHTGLTSQGWNYTLAEVKSQASAMGSCIVGHNLVTDDGKTRIYVDMSDSSHLTPTLGLYINGSVTVNWGDGTAADTLTGTSTSTIKTITHTYSSTGSYMITLTPSSGTTFVIKGSSGTGSGTYLLYDSSTSTTISTTNKAIIYNRYIKKIEIGNNVEIGTNAFFYCASLQSVSIPNTLTTIGQYAFCYCYLLKALVIPTSVTSINQLCVDCRSIQYVSLPKNSTTLNSNIFYDCTSLKAISLPKDITAIPDSTFKACGSVESIVIPSGVTSIGLALFDSCRKLASITIPSGVTSIGNTAFQNCISLKEIELPSGLTSIGNSAFNTCYLTSIDIPNTVTTVGTGIFSSCYILQSCSLSTSITTITDNMFNNCYLLSDITIPSGVTSIGKNAFTYCYSLTSITIPSGVTSIGTNAFQNANIVDYYMYPTTPPTLSDTNTFTGIQDYTKIHVPAASLSSYQTAQYWSSYSSYMVGDL